MSDAKVSKAYFVSQTMKKSFTGFSFLFSKILFLYFFWRGEGREKERERNINVWLVASCMPPTWGPGPQPRPVP